MWLDAEACKDPSTYIHALSNYVRARISTVSPEDVLEHIPTEDWEAHLHHVKYEIGRVTGREVYSKNNRTVAGHHAEPVNQMAIDAIIERASLQLAVRSLVRSATEYVPGFFEMDTSLLKAKGAYRPHIYIENIRLGRSHSGGILLEREGAEHGEPQLLSDVNIVMENHEGDMLCIDIQKREEHMRRRVVQYVMKQVVETRRSLSALHRESFGERGKRLFHGFFSADDTLPWQDPKIALVDTKPCSEGMPADTIALYGNMPMDALVREIHSATAQSLIDSVINPVLIRSAQNGTTTHSPPPRPSGPSSQPAVR